MTRGDNMMQVFFFKYTFSDFVRDIINFDIIINIFSLFLLSIKSNDPCCIMLTAVCDKHDVPPWFKTSQNNKTEGYHGRKITEINRPLNVICRQTPDFVFF